MQAMNDRPDLAFHLGDRLRKARENAGYDAKTFAMKVDITRDTLRKYENGKVRPRRHAEAEAADVRLANMRLSFA